MLILFGAGTTGRVIARDLKAKGVEAVFADNDPGKWDSVMEGCYVYSAQTAMREFPGATWVCSVVRPERAEILAQIASMGVKTAAMWDYVPKRYNLPPDQAKHTVEELIYDSDMETGLCWDDQLLFRANPSTYKQLAQSNIDHIYFEDFIVKRDDEHYVDCGAARDGDTVRDFRKWQPNYRYITAFEPDRKNYEALCKYHGSIYDDGPGFGASMTCADRAVGSHFKKNAGFVSTGSTLHTWEMDGKWLRYMHWTP